MGESGKSLSSTNAGLQGLKNIYSGWYHLISKESAGFYEQNKPIDHQDPNGVQLFVNLPSKFKLFNKPYDKCSDFMLI